MKLKMKTTATLLIVLLVSIVFGVPVLAVKPTGNLAGAEKVPWNLSGDVMPVPPYGSRDIDGSDDASKLIVNQPNGAVEVVLTGAMKGLDPLTTYQVRLSKGYTPFERWNVTGAWTLKFVYGGDWVHYMTIDVQTDGTFSGYGHFTGGSPTWTVSGTIEPGTGYVTMRIDYDDPSTYYVDVVGIIDYRDGTMSGTWSNPTQSGTWESIEGSATPVGDKWSPGLFHNQQMFTFTTDIEGSGSWHLNLRDDDFPGPGTYDLSVWINVPGATILVSDNFEVTVD